LQRRAWVHASVDQANALSANGQLAQAHALLEQVQPVAGNSPELIGVVASAFAQTKDDSRAIGLMRQLMALTSQPDAGLRIQYAGILLRTQQDAELAGVLRQVQGMQLTDAQRADFDRLQTALAIRQADNLRLRGDLPNAYEAIAPALAAHPDDPDLQSALARMYAATGEYNEALRLYIAAHQKRPDDLDLTLAAAGTASQAQNYSFAEDAIQSALKQAPNNAQVLAAAGRIYRADGKNGQAVTYLRKALAAENASTDGAGTSAGMSGASPQWAVPSTAQYVPGRPAANPFIGRTVIQPGAASAATSGEGLFFSGTRGEAASGAPTAGQFSGTGGPGSAPTMQPPAATSVQQGSYPYPTQAYPGQSAGQATGQPYYRPAVQPSPSQNMPYLPPNAPSQYLQQAPMPLPATRSAILRPSARNDAPASRVLARLGKPSADPTASEGADYDGASASGGGYAQQQQQPVYAPQQYQQANGYQQQQQQPVYAPQQYQQANGYQQQQQQPVYAPQQYQQANGYQQQQQQPVYAPQQYQQANGYQQQQQPVYAPQQYQQANGYQQQQQSVYAPQQYQQANGYQQQQQPVYAPQQYQQANAYQQQQQPVYAPRQYQQANGYQQQQQPVYQQQLPAYPQQPYAQQNGYRQAAPPPAQLPAPWPQDPAYAPTPTRIVAAVAPIPTDCDSIGADGGTRSAAGGSAAAQREIEECHAVKARKAPTRRIAASRLAPQRAPVYAQQQTYAPAYAQQPPLPQYQQPYQPQYAQQVAPQPMQQQVQQPVQQNVPAPMWNNGPGALAAAGPLSVQQELDQINQETTSTVSGGVSIHNRSGEQGLSALTDIEAPLEGRVRAGNGHIVVRVTPVTLDSGTADGRYDVSSRFGSGPAAATGSTAINAQNAQGVGLSAGYETNHYRLDVGTTPIGFKEQNVVGGLNYSGAISDKLTVTLEGSRRAVTDSLLSYAGVSDNRPGQSHTGQSWGGVTADTGRVGLTYDDGTNGLYGYGSYGYLSGDHVASNTRGEGGGGIYTRLLKDPDRELMAGVNVDVFGYNKNLSYFTYGQGGYFSPQQYISLSVPVSWSARTGRFSYQVKGALGIQHFREDDSPYFPTDANMQAAAVTAAAGSTTQTNPVYAGQSKTGLGYNFQVAGEYQLGPQIFAGATAGIDNARDYSQWFGGLYVRYAFEKMTGSMAMPPKPLHSPYLAN
jgi:tetratricopeptide (TPR) repeat protein